MYILKIKRANKYERGILNLAQGCNITVRNAVLHFFLVKLKAAGRALKPPELWLAEMPALLILVILYPNNKKLV